MRLLAITAGGDFHSAPRTFAVPTPRLSAILPSLPPAVQGAAGGSRYCAWSASTFATAARADTSFACAASFGSRA
jgi:hypothetical protein